jgi:PAS domain S-box-containing protein
MSVRAAAASATPRGSRRGESADHFRLMADCAPVMIWVASPDRKCVYFNRPWLEFTGRALDDELGFGWHAGIHGEDRERTLAAHEAAFAAWQPFEVEYRLRRRDGEHRWLLDKGVPLVHEGRLSGFVGSCLDITDRMRAEQAARKREEDFKTLAANIPDVIARFDRDLVCVYANRALEAALGLKPEQVVGKRLAALPLSVPVIEPLAGAAHAALAAGEERRFQFEAEVEGGQRRHFVGRVIPEVIGGSAEGVLVIAYDDTARAREDEKRAEMLAHERNARATAESATLARDQFLAIVSHELRSPLNGIKSWTHVLENQLEDPDPTVRRALAGIMIGVEHQVRLIEDLLDVTRALSGNLGLVKQPMPLLPVLADAVETLRATALEKGLHIVTDYSIADREIHGDPDRVRQIFVNLLSNAVKFTPAGGTVRVAASPEGHMARVEVRDDGVGIPPEFLPHVFDPFRQADTGASKRRQEGLGLGLALVQRLAELHGGYATCESEGVGHGAAFRVYLPLRREALGRVVAPSPSANIAASLPSLAGIHVLLIDDQREARESLAALLGQTGAAVTVAASGAEALSSLEKAAPREGPEVVVCDIAMPGEDGYATLKRLRAWEAAQSRGRRPAIALSAFTQREDRIRALAEGFQMHLTKPVAPAELVTVIASVARGMRM